MHKSCSPLLCVAAILAASTLSSCGPQDTQTATAEETRAAPPPTPYDPVEQALLGTALRKATGGTYTVKLVEHHRSQTSEIAMSCGTYMLEEDPQHLTRYFLSTSEGVSLILNPNEDRWQKYCKI